MMTGVDKLTGPTANSGMRIGRRGMMLAVAAFVVPTVAASKESGGLRARAVEGEFLKQPWAGRMKTGLLAILSGDGYHNQRQVVLRGLECADDASAIRMALEQISAVRLVRLAVNSGLADRFEPEVVAVINRHVRDAATSARLKRARWA